jgi:hypothetical protein
MPRRGNGPLRGYLTLILEGKGTGHCEDIYINSFSFLILYEVSTLFTRRGTSLLPVLAKSIVLCKKSVYKHLLLTEVQR